MDGGSLLNEKYEDPNISRFLQFLINMVSSLCRLPYLLKFTYFHKAGVLYLHILFENLKALG